ncbi:MAG TPA: glycosyltransferase family 1 protein [Longimicrobiales bacterium]|nr:glycosyltransferase family 1 protein [Longimicrobiales bacterium]
MMLRAIDEKGGIGVYANNIVAELLAIDDRNEYVLLYRNPDNLGRFAHHPNVEELVVRAPNKALWDQLAVPLACARSSVDVLFHPKFTVPFLAPCKTVMVVHGADWFLPDQAVFYKPLDVRYVRMVMPWYFRKAAKVLSVSELTTENFHQVLELPPGKVETTYFGPARHFAPVRSSEVLEEVRARYDLPGRFIFTLTKLGDGNRKNFKGLIEGYARYHARTDDPVKLVVGGKDCFRLMAQYRIAEAGYSKDVVFTGWLDQADLPAVYSMAELFLYPSNLEAFPIPITEAMACGSPIVTSNANGLKELADDAAELVDPSDPDDIAEGIARVVADPGLRADLSRRGLQRSKMFSWEKCARKTLRVLEGLAG